MNSMTKANDLLLAMLLGTPDHSPRSQKGTGITDRDIEGAIQELLLTRPQVLRPGQIKNPHLVPPDSGLMTGEQ